MEPSEPSQRAQLDPQPAVGWRERLEASHPISPEARKILDQAEETARQFDEAAGLGPGEATDRERLVAARVAPAERRAAGDVLQEVVRRRQQQEQLERLERELGAAMLRDLEPPLKAARARCWSSSCSSRQRGRGGRPRTRAHSRRTAARAGPDDSDPEPAGLASLPARRRHIGRPR